MRAILSSYLFLLAIPASSAEPAALFNGKDFTGWEGDTAKTWRIENGCIVGGSLDDIVPRNEFL